MENSKTIIDFEETTGDEIEDIWDIFFPKSPEKAAKKQALDYQEQTKPRRYLKFLTM
jgi:hypothetical protein